MEQSAIYEIYTDASFDEENKIGIYSIVVVKDNKTIKSFVKKCKIQLKESIECEIYAIYQAINYIAGSLLKKKAMHKFYLKTDCSVARDFFTKKNYSVKIFEENQELLNTIKKSYERIRKSVSKKKSSFELVWIPREKNKSAHKYSYSAFKKFKSVNYKSEIILLDKNSFLELLQKLDLEQYKVLIYLFQNTNQENLIVKTQSEISESLKLSTCYISQTFQKLTDLHILEKVKNGKYTLLI